MKNRRRRFFEIPKHIETEEEFLQETHNYISKDYFPKFKPDRWFTADDELLHHNGKTYSLHNQWGPKTEAILSYLVAAFPDSGISFLRE